MEIAIIKRESTGTGANTYNETETVAKFEIMDGAPVRGDNLLPVDMVNVPYRAGLQPNVFCVPGSQVNPSQSACFWAVTRL